MEVNFSLPDVLNADIIIGAAVKGMSFVDIGGLWGTRNEKVTVALESGAKSATMMDIMPLDDEHWGFFHERATERGFKDRYSSISCNLDSQSLLDKQVNFDFVHCSGIIYHSPDPLRTLMQLRAITNRYLILGSMTVPEKISNAFGEINMEDGEIYFIPGLHGKNLNIFREHFSNLGVNVHNINSQEKYPWLINLGQPNYAPWWWLWTAQNLARMAETVGFRTIAIYEAWPNRAHGIFLEPA
jgi:hypothetical protein